LAVKCPRCDATLNAAERQGVEIDVCPQCRGVWLDRGELDKIVERYDAYAYDDGPRHGRRYDGHRHAPAGRKSWWHELFD
jgi:Zn-finger nucleic acid-binding protein